MASPRFVVGFAMLACAAPMLRESPQPAPAAPVAELDGEVRRVVAVGQGLELLLPDADGWRHDARELHSWVATHAATHSRIVARAWHTDAILALPDCERQMRTWRPDLPFLPSDERIETRALRLEDGTAAELWSGASEPRELPKMLAGYVQLVASDGRLCAYLAYETSADGPDRTRRIGTRLAAMAHAFERVRRLDISERVRPRSP